MPNTNFQEIKLYKGAITLKFYPDSHTYFVNGKRCKSPTGAINIIDKSRQLIPWAIDLVGQYFETYLGKPITQELIEEAIDQPNKVKEQAKNIGTQAHDWIEAYVKGTKLEMPEEEGAVKAIMGFLEWEKKHKIKFVESEKLVYSKKHGYAGTLDAIAKVGSGRGLYIIDYKVSNGLYPGVALQTAAYQMAEEEESGKKMEGRWAIRLSKLTEEEYLAKEEKKLVRYMKKNPGKTYEIKPWQAFEARLLENYNRDKQAFLLALQLSGAYYEIDREFFNSR